MVRLLLACVFFALPLGACQDGSQRAGKIGPDTGPSALTIGPEFLPQFTSAAFHSTDKAWVVSRKGELLHTSDSGTSWDTISQTAIARFAVTSFINSRLGWAINRNGQIWKTLNGGQEWSELAFPEYEGVHIESPEQIRFVDELHGWIKDAFSIWRTEDGGVNWVRCLLMGQHESKFWQPTNASFLNASMAWVSSTNGLIHRTTNGGKTWHTQEVVANHLDVRLVQFINERTGWVSISDGNIYRSDDGGISWQRQTLVGDRIAIRSLHFVSSNEGWAVGWQSSADNRAPQQRSIQGIILHTTNGGWNWQPTNINVTESFFAYIYFVDSKHGWLYGRDSLHHTKDGGKTWYTVLQLPPHNSQPILVASDR